MPRTAQQLALEPRGSVATFACETLRPELEETDTGEPAVTLYGAPVDITYVFTSNEDREAFLEACAQLRACA